MPVIRESFHAVGVDAAEQHLRSHYGDVSMRGGRLSYDETVCGDRRFLLSRMRVEGAYAATADVAGITIVTGARGYRWSMGDEEGTGETAALFEPGRPMSCAVLDASVTVVVLDPGHLAETAGIVYGDDAARIRFDGAQPISDAHARAWTSAVGLAAASSPHFDNVMVRAATHRALSIAAFECFRLVGDGAERRRSAAASQGVYRRAARFLEDNASLPITVEDAAAAVGVPLRVVQRAFRAYAPNGVTPAQHLHRARLDAARDELLRSDGSPAAMDAIAQRWGFTADRFRRHYLDAYGIDPVTP
jgi:AraC-like DNA-binding protein